MRSARPIHGKTAVRDVPLESIRVPASRARALGDLEGLIASIGEVGMMNPIILSEDLTLIAGRHRLEACRRLQWPTIPAIVLSLEGLQRELAEIDENLVRIELTVLERGEHLARRKAIHEALHPETKRGVAGGRSRQGSATATVAFADDAAAKTGRSTRSIQEDVQIAEGLTPEVKETLRETPLADQKRELMELAREGDPTTQKQLAEQVISGQARSVSEARDQLAEQVRDAPLDVLDQLGQEVTDPGIQEAFTILLPKVQEVMAYLRAASKAWKGFHEELTQARRVKVVEGRGYHFVRNLIELDLKKLADLIAAEEPYTLCPYCQGSIPRCEGCGGGGWVARHVYLNAPEELRPGTDRKASKRRRARR